MKTNNQKHQKLCKVNSNGEIIYQKKDYTKMKYAPDSLFFYLVIQYLMLITCGSCDFFVFKSMFNVITYDNNTMKAFAIVGLLIGFDVIPIFIGIHLRRLRQGLSKDRFVLAIALAVTLMAVALNFGLRATTIDEMSPDNASSGQSYFGAVVSEDAEAEGGYDSTAIALTLFGCFLPLVTSLASFCVSYLTYDPLMIRKRREEELIHEKQDEIRRFDAILFDYESDSGFAERLEILDEGKYNEMLKLQRAKVIGYCDYVRQRLKEELANPVSNNVLSNDDYESILIRLDAELAALDEINTPEPLLKLQEINMTLDSVSQAIA